MRQGSFNSRNFNGPPGVIHMERSAHDKSAWRSGTVPKDSRFPFDANALFALVEEQRRLIALAAGVEPSKVKIQFGH